MKQTYCPCNSKFGSGPGGGGGGGGGIKIDCDRFGSGLGRAVTPPNYGPEVNVHS